MIHIHIWYTCERDSLWLGYMDTEKKENNIIRFEVIYLLELGILCFTYSLLIIAWITSSKSYLPVSMSLDTLTLELIDYVNSCSPSDSNIHNTSSTLPLQLAVSEHRCQVEGTDGLLQVHEPARNQHQHQHLHLWIKPSLIPQPSWYGSQLQPHSWLVAWPSNFQPYWWTVTMMFNFLWFVT